MIKQARFFVNLMLENSHTLIQTAACFYSTAILKKRFLAGVSMAIRGGKQGGFASRLGPPVIL
tara:strand:- start:132 stop:320 length:189 start_codon:yes stop_codon:yes gene_type:complete